MAKKEVVKEERLKNVVEVRKRGARVMAIVLVFTLEVVRIICAYAPQSGRTMKEKNEFYDNLAGKQEMPNTKEFVLAMGDLTDMLVSKWMDIKVYMGGM